jgi:protease-4
VAGLIALGVAFVLGIPALLAVGLLGAILEGQGGMPGDVGQDECPEMAEVWSSGSGTTRVVRIPLMGTIHFKQGSATPAAIGSTETTLRSIRRATLDESISGIFLDVDSGGGGITASDILYNALVQFRNARPNRVVVAHFGDTAASGAYYVSLAADRIYAHPTTLTGSIGVIVQAYDVHALAEKLGVKDASIMSGENKALLNPLLEMTPAQEALLREVVDRLHGRFVALVAENRDLPADVVRQFADGRVFLAPAALERGFIDGIGYEIDALDAAANLLGLESADDLEVIRYEEKFSFWHVFRGSPSFFDLSALAGILEGARSPRLLYQWTLR